MMKIYVPDIDGTLNIRDQNDVFGLVQTGHYEPEECQVIKDLVEKNDLCFDIGANIGYFTVLMAKISRYVYAFEPEPDNYKLLLDNIIENNLQSKVHPLMHAIGLNNSVGEMYKCPTNYGMHRLYESKWCEHVSIPVSIIALDSEFRGLIPNFIKMDTEGWEYQALLGMTTMLIKAQPKLLIEFHPPTLIEQGGPATPANLYNFLKHLDYDIYLATEIGNDIDFDTLFAKTNDEMGGQNIVCIPSRN